MKSYITFNITINIFFTFFYFFLLILDLHVILPEVGKTETKVRFPAEQHGGKQ